MTTYDEISDQELLPIKKLAFTYGSFLYLIPVSHFPMPENDLAWLMEICGTVIQYHKTNSPTLREEVIIKQSCLYTGLLDFFVDHASELMPRQGVAVIPHASPPHMPSKGELEGIDPRNLDPNAVGLGLDVPELVFWISEEKGKDISRKNLLGHGALHIYLTRLDEEKLYGQWREVFGKRVTDRLFRKMPFFMPLFGWQSFLEAEAKEVSTWLASFDLYIGESIEDKGIIIASKKNIDIFLAQLASRLPELISVSEENILRW